MLMDTIRVLVSQTFALVEAENVAKYAGLKGEPVACAFLLSNVTSYDRNVSLYDNTLANCRFRQYIYAHDKTTLHTCLPTTFGVSTT